MALLRLFGPAREAAGAVRLELPGACVGEVLDAAETELGDEFARIVRSSRIWLNGEPTQPEDRLDEGDELAVLPPVSGG